VAVAGLVKQFIAVVHRMLFTTLNRSSLAAQRTHERTETPPTPTKMDSIQVICWSVRRCVLVSAGFHLASAGFFVSSQGRDGVVGWGRGGFSFLFVSDKLTP